MRQARRAQLLAHLHANARRHGWLEATPAGPRQHLEAAAVSAEHLRLAVRRELRAIRTALAPLDCPVVLLKGAAYAAAGLRAGEGRVFSDIDLLVPRPYLEAAERALLGHGWVSAKTNAYDQRYYRQWMHELPPMRHSARGSVVDLHHNILPDTARHHPSSERLITAAESLPADPLFSIPSTEDRILHCTTHLFCEGEFDQGLRDLVDLRALLAPLGTDPDRWQTLVARAREMDLARPLYHGLVTARAVLGIELPQQSLRELTRDEDIARPNDRWLLPLFRTAVRAVHSTCEPRGADLARWLLYVRGHYLRMPLPLLLSHLTRKAFRRREGHA